MHKNQIVFNKVLVIFPLSVIKLTSKDKARKKQRYLQEKG